ncbi:MAG: glycerophosphodiester phosphodiesterase family protein, partial [Proteobacteria bacterium]|nr:glycerophosphodiester phosphodiesterase family protein [Pseudomonadota bacterium]
MIRLPRIIGHRGAAAAAPGNTREGLRAAAAAGIDWVEFDVRLSADHVPVVIHDATLARTAGVEARIDRTTAANIASLTRVHPTPTLAEAMALLGELGLGANVEIKAVRARRAVAVAVVKTLDAVRRDRSIPVLVSSFSRAILENMRGIADYLPRGLLLSRGMNDAIGLARRLGCVSIHEDHRRLTSRQVADWKAAGFLVVCYTVNDPARAGLLFDW